MTSIMLWDRQNYFQTYEFELFRKLGFYLILTTEEQGRENFLKAFLLNGLYFFPSVIVGPYSYQPWNCSLRALQVSSNATEAGLKQILNV